MEMLLQLEKCWNKHGQLPREHAKPPPTPSVMTPSVEGKAVFVTSPLAFTTSLGRDDDIVPDSLNIVETFSMLNKAFTSCSF